MFISVNHLHKDMGVDEKIARFFVDRKVPADNAFWEKRLLYIGRGNGFVSIPVYYDLLCRIGIPKELLMDEGHIYFMEQVMNFAIQVEFKRIDFNTQLEKIKQLLADRITKLGFYNELLSYFNQPVLKPKGRLGMQVPALNRADVFLFILCDLPLTDDQVALAIKCWYALHSTYLLMDDMYDYKIDKQDKEENSIIELGDEEQGFKKAFDILNSNIITLKPINPVLSNFFYHRLESLHQLNA